MRFTFLHTADWQIGKRFGSFPGDKPAVLRDQRLQAVDRLAQAAIAAGCSAVLVAGDVFDAETVPEALSGQLMARLKSLPDAHLALCCRAITIRPAAAACGARSSAVCRQTCACISKPSPWRWRRAWCCCRHR